MKCILFIFSLLLLVSCEKKVFREGKVFAGGKYVSADTLNLGRSTYMEYCVSCHGVNGDGNGVASKGLVPVPRDFRQGLFKFGNVISGELPTDQDLERIVRKGLKGTAMLPWDISDQRLNAVVQYIKTFAPKVWEGKDKKVGENVALTTNPYRAQKDYAIKRGKKIYHMEANCQSCHRAYATKKEFDQMSMEVNNTPYDDLEDETYLLKNQESEYKVPGSVAELMAMTLPPDFTWHEIRSASTVDELYLRLASGVGGTSMPSWKDTLEDADIWAVAYYVRSLMDLKETPGRQALMDKLKGK